MKNKKVQSLSRQIRRGNAMLVFNNVTKGIEAVVRYGTPLKTWLGVKKWRVSESEKHYISGITKPRKVTKRDSRGKAIATA